MQCQVYSLHTEFQNTAYDDEVTNVHKSPKYLKISIFRRSINIPRPQSNKNRCFVKKMLEFNDGKKMLKFSQVMKLPERELKRDR